MAHIHIIERDIKNAELKQMRAGFIEYQVEHGVVSQIQQRFSFVLSDDERFVGCVSGLTDNNWFYLSDLWLAKDYRNQGLGATLLKKLEGKVASVGIRNF